MPTCIGNGLGWRNEHMVPKRISLQLISISVIPTVSGRTPHEVASSLALERATIKVHTIAKRDVVGGLMAGSATNIASDVGPDLQTMCSRRFGRILLFWRYT